MLIAFHDDAYDLTNPVNVSENNFRFKLLSKFIGSDIFEFMKKNKSFFVDLKKTEYFLRGSMDKESVAYFNLSETEHRMDKRKPVEYAQSLILSRILEIYALNYFKEKYNREWRLNGCDKTDIVNTKEQITNDPDFITANGCFIELMSDWKSYAIKRNGLHFRDKKLNHLIDFSKKSTTKILFIDVPLKKFQFTTVDDSILKRSCRKEEIKEFGGKPGYFVPVDIAKYKDF